MATFDGKYLKGLVGNVVVRSGKKKQIIQAAPTVVRQTEPTKKSASIFGQGSKLAKAIRHNLRFIIDDNYDSEMINRFHTPITTILKQCHNIETNQFDFQADSFDRLAGFEFNTKSLLINNLWVKPEIRFSENTLTVSIPEIAIPAQLKFSSKANCCELQITVSQIVLHDGVQHSPLLQQIEINKDQKLIPAQDFSFEIRDGVFCVVGIGLNYFSLYKNIKTILNSKNFNPAGIIGAIITPGTFTDPGPILTATGGRATDWSPVFNLNL